MNVKSSTIAIAAVMLMSAILSAQGLADLKNLPPGFVNGSINPELVPDNSAYRLVFLSLRTAGAADSSAVARQNAKLGAMGLAPSDAAAVTQIIGRFSTQYLAWQGMQSAAGAAAAITIVEQARTSLSSNLSTEGLTKFAQYVQAAKARMIVRP
jgi:hypothetical protein